MKAAALSELRTAYKYQKRMVCQAQVWVPVCATSLAGWTMLTVVGQVHLDEAAASPELGTAGSGQQLSAVEVLVSDQDCQKKQTTDLASTQAVSGANAL